MKSVCDNKDYLVNLLIRDKKNKSIEYSANELFDLSNRSKNVPPILTISAHLIKLQLLEYEIKQLLLILDKSIETQLKAGKSVIKILPKNKKDIEKLPLGRAIEQFLVYDNDIVNPIKPRLGHINTSRNNFVHHLFSSKVCAEILAKEALLQRKDVEFVIEELRRLEKYLFSSVIYQIEKR